MKIDLHIHTNHSFDCHTPVEEAVKSAEKAGLDAIAITDHDTFSAIGLAQRAAKTITIIPGMEITTTKGTHIIGLFLRDEIFSRDIFDVIGEIHKQGGLVMLPHPFRNSSGLIYAKDKLGSYLPNEIREILAKIDLLEAINLNCGIDELSDTNNFFAVYPDLPQTAGSDSHRPEKIGAAYVDLETVRSKSPNDIKKALLTSPRTIRYEAYRSESDKPEVRQIQMTPKKKPILKKTFNIIGAPIGRSIQTIYKKTGLQALGNVLSKQANFQIREED